MAAGQRRRCREASRGNHDDNKCNAVLDGCRSPFFVPVPRSTQARTLYLILRPQPPPAVDLINTLLSLPILLSSARHPPPFFHFCFHRHADILIHLIFHYIPISTTSFSSYFSAPRSSTSFPSLRLPFRILVTGSSKLPQLLTLFPNRSGDLSYAQANV